MKNEICILVFLISSSSFADVLFVDLNMSSKEIEAAERGARARGEKLIVIPKVNAATRKKLETAQSKVYQYTGFLATRCNQNASGQTDLSTVGSTMVKQCSDMFNKESAAKQELEDIKEANPTKMSSKSLQEEIAEISKSGVRLTSLVISGHDGHGAFSGINGEFNYKDFESAFSKNKPVGDDIRSLALWGCESVTPGSAGYFWQGILPKLEIIAGFDGVAPSNDRKAGHDYLESFLKQEKKLTEIKDQKALKTAFKKLEGVNIVTASLCTTENFISHQKSLNIKSEINKCLGEDGLRKIKKYNCIINSKDECKNMNQADIKKEVVDLYNTASQLDFCSADMHPSSYLYLPTKFQLHTLANFENVITNFKKNHVEEISQIQKIMTQINPEKANKIDFNKATDWPSYVTLHNQLKKFLESEYSNSTDIDKPNFANLKALSAFIRGLHSNFSKLQVPVEYGDPNSTVKLRDFKYLQKTQYKNFVLDTEKNGAEYKLEVEFNAHLTKDSRYKEAELLSQNNTNKANKIIQDLYKSEIEKLRLIANNKIDNEKATFNRPHVVDAYMRGFASLQERLNDR